MKFSNRSRGALRVCAVVLTSLTLDLRASEAWAAKPAVATTCTRGERSRVTTVDKVRMQCVPSGTGFVWKRLPSKVSANDLRALVGTWNVASGSQAGYRVREFFVGGVAKSEAVGRTNEVRGSMVIESQKGIVRIRSVKVIVDATTLKSDKPSRDEWLQTKALETAKHPQATFDFRGEESFDPPSEGEVWKTEFRGDITIHGVTKPATIAIEARRTGTTIDVVGSTRILLADHAIEAPVVPGIVTADDTGILEFSLVLTK